MSWRREVDLATSAEKMGALQFHTPGAVTLGLLWVPTYSNHNHNGYHACRF